MNPKLTFLIPRGWIFTTDSPGHSSSKCLCRIIVKSILFVVFYQVVDSYGYGFDSGYLVSNFDLIVVNLDARGTCCRGER